MIPVKMINPPKILVIVSSVFISPYFLEDSINMETTQRELNLL